MPRVVIDSNIVVSSLLSATAPPARIMLLVRRGDVDLIVTRPILIEYEEVLNKPKIAARHRRTPNDVVRLIYGLSQYATMVQPVPQPGVVIPSDPDDEKFIEAAVAGSAEFIVSGDKHLLALGAYLGIRIVTPAAFAAYAASQPIK